MCAMENHRSDISKADEGQDAVASGRSASSGADTPKVSLDDVYGAPTSHASDSSEQTTSGNVMGESIQ